MTDARYTARGATEKLTYANGVRSFFVYDDARGWVENIRHYKDGITIQQSSYARDAKGRITGVVSTGAASESWSYGYDNLDRLITATNSGDAAKSRSYSYDDSGNITAQTGTGAPGTYVYPSPTAARPHAPLSVGGQSFSYDARLRSAP